MNNYKPIKLYRVVVEGLSAKEKAQEIKDELWINHSVIADIEEYIN